MHHLSLFAVLPMIVASGVYGPVATGRAQAAQETSPIITPADPALAIETLFTTTFPAATIPTTSSGAFLLWHATIAPGTQVAILRGQVACCPGPKIEHVLAGELTLRVEGPLQVVRGTSEGTPAPAEAIAPETAVMLRAGDTAIYALEFAVTYRNPGTDPVHLASGGLFTGVPPVPPADYAIDSFAGRQLSMPKERSPASPLPLGPLTVTLLRTTLAPEAVFPAPPSEAVQVVMSGPELGSLGVWGDGSAQNLAREPTTVYVLILGLAGPAVGTPASRFPLRPSLL